MGTVSASHRKWLARRTTGDERETSLVFAKVHVTDVTFVEGPIR
jgi:hypothetical protein